MLLDLDGVVYRGDQAIPGAPEALERVRRLGIRMLFLTNNSARTPEQVAAKLEGIGVRAAPDEVLTSALATAHALGRELAGLDRGSPTAFVIGERGIREALSGVGIELLDGEPDAVDAVVIGWDRSVDYAKLRTAALLVQGGAR
ncbi:MAG TPA: haloacid dehalogenase, partial [Actinomycetota bacterium]|nr:haloacid dehalogenase [Actinomycetota bacterium]